MSKITTITLLCDNPRHYLEIPATDTRTLTVGGVSYQTDLCLADSAKMTAALAKFTASARSGKPARVKPVRTAEMRRHAAAVRKWWAANPRAVPAVQWTERGRIPASVVAEYDRRHGGHR